MTHQRYTPFAEAINAHPEAKAAIPLRTRKRYEAGDVPRSIRLLFDYPDVFATLAQLLTDTQDSTNETADGSAVNLSSDLQNSAHKNGALAAAHD